MTEHERIGALLRRVMFKNPPFPIEVMFVPRRELGDARARTVACVFEIRVACRETGRQIRVSHPFTLNTCMDDEQLLRIIHAEARRVFLHELDECFHVDGERVHDPHANDHR